jgi:hypothetical protein
MRLFQYWFVVGFLIILLPATEASDRDQSTFWQMMRASGKGAMVTKVHDHGRTIYYLTHDTNASPVLGVIQNHGRQFSTATALRAEFESELEGNEISISLGNEVEVFNDSNDQSIRVLNFTKVDIATLYGVTIDKVTDLALHGIPIDTSTDGNVMPMSSESDVKGNWYFLPAVLVCSSGGFLIFHFGIRKRLAQKRRMKNSP